MRKYFKSFVSNFHYGYAMQFMKSGFENEDEKERVISSSIKHIAKAKKWAATSLDKVQCKIVEARLGFINGEMNNAKSLKLEAIELLNDVEQHEKEILKLQSVLNNIFKPTY